MASANSDSHAFSDSAAEKEVIRIAYPYLDIFIVQADLSKSEFQGFGLIRSFLHPREERSGQRRHNAADESRIPFKSKARCHVRRLVAVRYGRCVFTERFSFHWLKVSLRETETRVEKNVRYIWICSKAAFAHDQSLQSS
jgi:hypothetical protein